MVSEVHCNVKGELDDSGCVQDDTTQNCELSMMDMPDDVLLHILKYCLAPECKALAYCCTRLCSMVQERMLWRHVDARTEPCSGARLRWYLDNVLQEDTNTLLLSGFAKDVDGCLGSMNVTREEGEKAKCDDTNWDTVEHMAQQLPAGASVAQQRKIFAPRCSMPMWADYEQGRAGPGGCVGPQFSLSHDLLRRLAAACPQLSTLALEYCNIDCRDTNLGNFPKTLTKLSLRGCRCYNVVMEKTFLFRINIFLPHLQSLDASECEWLDPATLLPLSKLPELTELRLRDCSKLTEFVAYASLTSRYGFKALKSLDLRGSPVGDSEVSALGWLPRLERLWLARTQSARDPHTPAAHAHYLDDPAVKHVQLHPWEETEPHLLRVRPNHTYYYYDDVAMEINEREREGLKRKPEEIENEEIKRSPKRVREDDYYKRRDELIHLSNRFLLNIENNSLSDALKMLEQTDDIAIIRDNDAVNDNDRADGNANDSNENDAEMKDISKGGSETVEPDNKDNLEKNENSKNCSQNSPNSKSDDNDDDNFDDDNFDDDNFDDDNFDDDNFNDEDVYYAQNQININAQPMQALVIEINLKEGTQTRSFINLNSPGRLAAHSNGSREVGESSKSANRNEENLESAEKREEKENADIPNAGNVNAEIRNAGNVNAEIPNAGNVKEEVPNAGNVNAEIPNAGNVNAEIPNAGNVKEEVPNAGNVNAEIPNAGNVNAEIPNAGNVIAEIPIAGNVNADFPNAGNVNTEIPNAENVNAEIPNAGNVNAKIPNAGNVNVEIPNAGNVNVEIPNAGNVIAVIPNAGNVNADFPNAGNLNTEIPNAGNVNAEIPNAGNVNAEIPNAGNVNVEIPNVGNLNAEIPNVGNESAEIPNTENINAEIPNVGNESAEIPNAENLNAEIPNVGNESAEIPNAENINAEIPNVGNESAEIPNLGNENEKIPNAGNANIPIVENVNVQISNVRNVNVEIQNLGNEYEKIPIFENGNGEIPNVGNENAEIPRVVNGNGGNQDHPNVNREDNANGARAEPPQNGNFVESLKIDGILNFREMRGDDHGEVIVFSSGKMQPAPVNEGASTSRDNPSPRVEDPIDYRIEPRHHVLYVNVGRRRSTYRFPRNFVAPGFPDFSELNVQRQHVDSSALVTDFAIRRFGRADGEDVNIIHLGPNGPVVLGGPEAGARPDRSTLRFLSVNGYRNITDRSLTHLATAAPNLEHVDFSDTSVSDAGAEAFLSLRPECKLIYSKFTEKEE